MAGERLRFCLISALFLLSGASALVYETAWLRQILLIVGSTTGAVSTVLAVFMLGLGLGARWVGGLADRSPSPLRLYALLELGVGLYGLALPFVFEALAPAYLAVVRGASGQGVLQMLVRVIFAFVLLLPPTLLMGATFPVLVRLAEGRRFDRQLGMLYGANLWGAVAGCLATGFVLIRFLGVRGAILAAVNINLGLSLVALVWSRWERMVPRGDAKETAVPRPATALSTGTRRAVWGLVFASGFATMAFEVLWMRILSFPFQSTMYAFTVILATFLAGLALGSALCARLESWVPPLTLLAAVQLGAGLTTLLLLAVARRPEKLIVAMVGPMGMSGMSFVVAMAMCSAIAVLLPATLMGVVFPLSAKLLVRDLRQSGRDVGAAYLVNSLGSVTGSVATPFVLVPLLGLKTSVIAVCATQATLGLLLLKGCEVAATRRRLAWVAASLAVLGASGLALRSLQGPLPFDDLSAEGKGAVVEAHHDDATATVAVVRYPDGYRSLRIDGFEATSDHFLGEYMPMMTHVPMLLHPDPKQVLVLCFGTGSTAGAGLLYPEARIDAVDINPSVFGFAPFFRKVNHAVVENPRTRLILDDGRNFLLTSRGRYDVITAEPMPPRFAGVVNFYTREYYELARDHLNEGGFLVQWLPVHLLTLPQSLRVLRTARDVFPEVSLWMHRGTGIIVCRRGGALSVDVGRVRARLGEPELGAELSRLEVGTVSSFLKLYVLGPEAVARLTSVVAPITDDRPTLEFDPPVHPWGPNEQSRSLEVFFIARKGVSPVLMNSGAEEMATLEAAYADSSFTLLGDLYAQHGLHEKALAEYRAGFERARRPEGRALFLFAQAKLAQVNGQREEARRLLEEGLALEPGTVWARELHRQLGGS